MAKRNPEIKFLMIMPKHDLKLWDDIYNNSKTLKNLTFIEKVSFEKINKYFAEASLFVSTAMHEGFPNTFVQATMYGVPIVSLSVNPDNFINKYKCGFFVDDNVEIIYNQVVGILKKPTEWKILSENSYKYAQENHNIEKNIVKLKEIINILIKKK